MPENRQLFQQYYAPEGIDDPSHTDAEPELLGEVRKVTSFDGGGVYKSVAALLLEGKTPSQIGELLGIKADKVSAILLLPHTQEHLTLLASKMGEPAVDAALKSSEFSSVMRLIEIRDKSPDRKEQLMAIKQLWIMRRGNVPTKIGKGEEDSDEEFGGDLGAKVSNLDQRIKSLIEQQSSGKNVNLESLQQ